ncbi:MAG TPA: glycosyltransferase family 2 protein [Blastocatellia bacterium]|nr:glycosyltransferase family 2 protein [Blastocatellia bacterium]
MALDVRSSADVASGRGLLRASIIIVNYNAKEMLLRCIESVLRTSQSDCEVIVLDNDSSDGMADLIEARYSQVALIRSDTNLGFGAGNNLAALRAQGKYLVFLNPDTMVDNGWLESLLAPFETCPEAGLVTAKILLADQPDLINACGNSVHLTGLALCCGLGQPRTSFNKTHDVDAVSGAAFAIRQELFEALGGFDEDTFLYMEDTDLSWRARLAGTRCLFTPESIVFHHYTLRITPRKVFYQERNRYLMLLKILRWRSLFILLPAYVLAEVMTWGFVLYRDRANFKNKLQAYSWIINNWQAVLRKRRNTQALRRVRDRELIRHTNYKVEFEVVSRGIVGRLAQIIFNPLFFILRGLAMMLIWW